MWDEPLRFQAHLPIYFWGECVLAAVHLINRTPSPLLQNKTPYEMLFGTPPSYNVIRTFGCLYFGQNQQKREINLLVKVGSASLWVILLVKRGGTCLILIPKNFLFPE